MRKLHLLFSVFMMGTMILAACNFAVAPPGTEAPLGPSQPPGGIEPPALTEVPIEATEPPTLVPIDLSGPPMEVGSKFLYVDGSMLIAVPGGEFTMGHGGEDNPEHLVNVSDFWIYRAKVTNSQYGFCVSQGKCTSPNPVNNPDFGDPLKANHPVVGVDHSQAAAYCAMVNGRLPTEAEWEKTARGPEGNIYPWGEAAPTCDLLNYANCKSETSAVTDYPQGQSYYEALDMAGNAYEWVADWYEKNYYSESPVEDPPGPEFGIRRSVRSNGFNSPAYESESARRFALNPIVQRTDLGFRCVVEDPTYFAPFCETTVVYGQDATTGLPVVGQYSESCPDVGIKQNSYCNGTLPATNVNFTGPSNATIDPDGCTPSGNPNQYVCQSTGKVSITADCTQNLPGNPQCPQGYTQTGTTCTSQGGSGACLPGYTYDPVNQCCSPVPGSDSSFGLPNCPTGTYFLAGQNACIPYPAKGLVTVTQTIGLLDCTPDKRQGGGRCPPQDCSAYYMATWNSQLCCCYSAVKGGCQ